MYLLAKVRRHPKLLTGAAAALTFAALAALVVPRLGHIMGDISRVPAWVFVAALVLGLVSLLLRGEVWRTCLAAVGGQSAERRPLHAANSFGMLGNSVNHYIGPAVRISLLRRMDVEGSPKLGQMIAADAPVLLTEAGLACLLFAAAVGSAGLPLWLPLAAGAGVCTLVGLLWMLRRRTRRTSVRGLNVLVSAKYRRRMLAMIGAAVGLQLARTYLLLAAMGLHPQPWQVAMTFCATGVLGLLPLGPATSSGATLAVFGAHAATAAAAAGMVMTAMAFATALVYAAWGLTVLVRRLDVLHLLNPRRLRTVFASL